MSTNTVVRGLSADAFKRAFRNHAAGVAIITADAGNGPVGLTATSVFSVSAEPALLVFSVSDDSSSVRSYAKPKTWSFTYSAQIKSILRSSAQNPASTDSPTRRSGTDYRPANRTSRPRRPGFSAALSIRCRRAGRPYSLCTFLRPASPKVISRRRWSTTTVAGTASASTRRSQSEPRKKKEHDHV